MFIAKSTSSLGITVPYSWSQSMSSIHTTHLAFRSDTGLCTGHSVSLSRMFPSMLVYQVGRYILQGPSKIEFTVVSPSIVEERKAATLRMQARTSRVLKGSKSSSALEGNKKLARLGAANKGGQKVRQSGRGESLLPKEEIWIRGLTNLVA